MKQYELLVVFKPNADSDEVDKLVAKITSDVEASQGSVVSVDKMGRKKLAYEINNFRDGFFASFILSIPETKVVDFKRQLKLNESILRNMFIVAAKTAQEV